MFFCMQRSQIDDERFSWNPTSPNEVISMATVEIFDKPLCCSTGVCGTQVDPVLPRFAADLQWLQRKGHTIERFNLAQDPTSFASNTVVQKMLAEEGVECLPLVMVDQRIVSRSEYPSRDNLALWTGTSVKEDSLPVAVGDECCGGTTGCC